MKIEVDRDTARLLMNVLNATAENAERCMKEDPSYCTYPEESRKHIEALRWVAVLIGNGF
jgi:hypothetical protein